MKIFTQILYISAYAAVVYHLILGMSPGFFGLCAVQIPPTAM
jgi:hypothetical protein